MPRLGGNLGRHLLSLNIITSGQLAFALQQQRVSPGMTLGAILVEHHFATGDQIARAEGSCGASPLRRLAIEGAHAS